ncbi:MAG TPA: hypothetical protein VII78_09760 [Myxococcota bacterium]
MSSWLLQSFPLIGTCLFVGVSMLVSIRLLLLARRTNRRPELYLGLGLLGTAVLGYGVMISAAILRGMEQAVSVSSLDRWLQAFGQIVHDAGVSMTVLFVLTVFRPTERWARVLAGTLVAALWIGHVGWELGNRYEIVGRGHGLWWLRYGVIWTYPIWTMVESYRYWATMRRRVAVGLAEPLIANRFFLWGTGSFSSLLAIWTSSSSFFLADSPEILSAWAPTIQVATAAAGIATVSLYYLTFFPPLLYQRWIAGSAPLASSPR